jgi:hypothetical protein
MRDELFHLKIPAVLLLSFSIIFSVIVLMLAWDEVPGWDSSRGSMSLSLHISACRFSDCNLFVDKTSLDMLQRAYRRVLTK